MKLQVKRAFKSYFFVTKKVIKKQAGSAWKLLQPLIPVCGGAYIPSFNISVPFFCCTLFSENYLNPQVRINKMVNKHTVDYHHIPSQLISRIHSHISLDSIFLWNQKSVHFYSCPHVKLFPRFLSLPHRQKEITHSSRTAFSEDLFFPQQKGGGRIMELKKLPKLNLGGGYWSQVLISSTIFATLTFLVSVLLCHNLVTSMLKCEGSLT